MPPSSIAPLMLQPACVLRVVGVDGRRCSIQSLPSSAVLCVFGWRGRVVVAVCLIGSVPALLTARSRPCRSRAAPSTQRCMLATCASSAKKAALPPTCALACARCTVLCRFEPNNSTACWRARSPLGLVVCVLWCTGSDGAARWDESCHLCGASPCRLGCEGPWLSAAC